MTDQVSPDGDRPATRGPSPSPLSLDWAKNLPPEFKALDDLLPPLRLPFLAEVRTARCPRAREVAIKLARPFDRIALGRQIAAVQECIRTKDCCARGELGTLVLALELRLAKHGDAYGADPEALNDHVQTIRMLLGHLLGQQAQTLDYRAPSAAQRVSRMAETYLAYTVGRQAELGAARSRQDWTRLRLAQSIVTRSRYESAHQAELDWVMDEALRLLASDHPPMVRMARELVAQAALLLLPTVVVDLPPALWEGLPPETAGNEGVFVRLAQLGLTYNVVGRPEYAGWAVEVLQSVFGAPTTPRVMRRVAGVLLAWQATTEGVTGQTPSLVGLRHVFDFPRHLAQSPQHVERTLLTRTFIANLRQQFGNDTSSMYLDLLAGLYDELAREQLKVGDDRGAIESYRAALAEGSLTTLHTADESLRVAQRHFELGRLTQESQSLELGLRLLDVNAAFRTHSADPYLALARQMERGGLPVLATPTCSVEFAHECAVPLYATGDAIVAYSAAARRALRSNTMRRLPLGGRSGAEMPISLSDFSASGWVVIKGTTSANLKRELAALERLEAARTSVWNWVPARYVGCESIEPSLDNPQATVAAFWQWTDGTSAAAYLDDHPSRVKSVMECLSRSLAQLHLGLEPLLGSVRGAPPEVRQYYRSKQVGMWLRRLKPHGHTGRSPLEVFNLWFEAHDGLGLPWTPRTDAHLKNWVVDDDGEKVVRLDLEAVGWAPFGYELAQLTDDFRVLDQSAEAWAVRRSCLRIYLETVGVLDDDVQEGAAWEAYLLSLVMRASRPLSSGVETRRALGALELLEAVAARTTRTSVLDLCSELRAAWDQRRPQPTTAISDALVELFEPAAQTRASKRLAHLLRHKKDVVRDEHGWVELDIVVDHLAVMRDYANLPSEDLSRFVITLIQRYDEARFEYREGRVRAKYGQSVPVAYEQQSGLRASSARRPRLFHGTTYAAVASIFASGGSLHPMSRSWVHLSSDVTEALRVGSRHGEPIVLEISESAAGEAIQAGEHTWVIGEVPNTELRITPLHELPAAALRLPPAYGEV